MFKVFLEQLDRPVHKEYPDQQVLQVQGVQQAQLVQQEYPDRPDRKVRKVQPVQPVQLEAQTRMVFNIQFNIAEIHQLTRRTKAGTSAVTQILDTFLDLPGGRLGIQIKSPTQVQVQS